MSAFVSWFVQGCADIVSQWIFDLVLRVVFGRDGLVSIARRPEPAGHECPSCGRGVMEGDVFCRACGAVLSEAARGLSADPQPSTEVWEAYRRKLDALVAEHNSRAP